MWERRRQVRGLVDSHVEEPSFSEEDHRLKHRVWLPYLVVCAHIGVFFSLQTSLAGCRKST